MRIRKIHNIYFRFIYETLVICGKSSRLTPNDVDVGDRLLGLSVRHVTCRIYLITPLYLNYFSG